MSHELSAYSFLTGKQEPSNVKQVFVEQVFFLSCDLSVACSALVILSTPEDETRWCTGTLRAAAAADRLTLDMGGHILHLPAKDRTPTQLTYDAESCSLMWRQEDPPASGMYVGRDEFRKDVSQWLEQARRAQSKAGSSASHVSLAEQLMVTHS